MDETSAQNVVASETETQPAPGADEQKPNPPPAGDVPAEEAAAETPEQQQVKEKSKFARRLDRQKTARIAAETEAKLLREQLAKREAQDAQQQQVSGEPKEENYQDYKAYLRDLTKWEAKQASAEALKTDREAARSRETQQAGSEKVAKAWTEREKSFEATTKDYESVVAAFAEDELQNLSREARMAIVESDVGPALLYYLAKNPEEAERIAELSPVRQSAELGKLETKVAMPAKRTTNAPAPANITTGGKTATKDLSKLSQTEYEAERKKQGATWAR